MGDKGEWGGDKGNNGGQGGGDREDGGRRGDRRETGAAAAAWGCGVQAVLTVSCAAEGFGFFVGTLGRWGGRGAPCLALRGGGGVPKGSPKGPQGTDGSSDSALPRAAAQGWLHTDAPQPPAPLCRPPSSPGCRPGDAHTLSLLSHPSPQLQGGLWGGRGGGGRSRTASDARRRRDGERLEARRAAATHLRRPDTAGPPRGARGSASSCTPHPPLLQGGI